jgi:integrase/recombinase XerC
MSKKITIDQAISAYLDGIALSRSANTHRTYTNALKGFRLVLDDSGLVTENSSIAKLNEEAVGWFASALKGNSATTEQLYLTAVCGFFEYLAAEKLSEINLPRMRLLVRQRARRPGRRLPQFPREQIEQVIAYAEHLTETITGDPNERLRNYRDRAFLITLADTGLRVHEACALRRGDIDWVEQRAVIIGKGNKQAVVRFSRRAIRTLRDYLSARQEMDGKTGRAITSLPLFARHDQGAGGKTKPITTATGRNIVTERVRLSIGAEAIGTITPHSFRHYFVTTVLRGSGGNLKLAQELARHENISVTQRYAHLSDDELDQGYADIFEEI